MADGNLTRVALDGTVAHEGGQQFVDGQGYGGDRWKRMHRPEPHGFASHPVSGGVGFLLNQRGNRESGYVLGGENPDLRPKDEFLTAGGTAIYDAAGNIVSVVGARLRIVHSIEIHLAAPKIVLEGDVYLGGEAGAVAASKQGTIDSAGHTDVDGLATRVFVV